MNKIIDSVGFVVAAVILGSVAFVVVGACAFCLPFRWLIDWDVKREKDKAIRDRANLIMLKTGRFGS
jgi:hypothetical protein